MRQLVISVIGWFERHKKISVLFVLAGMAIVFYPRFNRNDLAIIRPFVGLKQGEISPDIRNYVNFTDYFKHSMPLDSVSVPFSYRPLVPYLASLLPTDSLLGVVIVNIVSFVLSVLCFFFILKNGGFPFGLRIAGCLLYIFSFPAFYYVSAGYIDSSGLLIICAIVLATVYRKYLAIPALFLVGALVKEVIIIAVPFMFIYCYQHRDKEKYGIAKIFILGVISVSLFLAAYLYSRTTFGSVRNYVWSPTFSSLYENAIRPKTYLSFILSFGFTGLLASIQIIADLRKFRLSNKSIVSFFNSTNTPLISLAY